MLKMSTLFLRTLRDDPADAEVASHKLLVRAGYVRRIAAGIYSWLPLGVITLRNVERVIREEMDNAVFKRLIFQPYFHVRRMRLQIAGKSTAHHYLDCKIARVEIIF